MILRFAEFGIQHALRECMKALEHLLIQEISQIRAEETKLHSVYRSLQGASTDQVEEFLKGLSALNHRACRVEEMLEAMAVPEPIAA